MTYCSELSTTAVKIVADHPGYTAAHIDGGSEEMWLYRFKEEIRDEKSVVEGLEEVPLFWGLRVIALILGDNGGQIFHT